MPESFGGGASLAEEPMRQNREANSTSGLFQPSGLWLLILGALLLTVTGSGGQESQVRPPATIKVAKKGSLPDRSQIISYDDATLEITNAALDGDFELVIQPLDWHRVAPMD